MSALEELILQHDEGRTDYGCWGRRHGRNNSDGMHIDVRRSPWRHIGLCSPCGFDIVWYPLPSVVF